MRNIKTIIVSVNYIDLLSFSYNMNKSLINDITIITSKSDHITQKFCNDLGIDCYATDAFFDNGCHFNKAQAMNEYLYSIPLEKLDWILFLDSDIILNQEISNSIHNQELNPNHLYGCARKCYNTKKDFDDNIFEYEPCRMWGFFHLFNKKIFSYRYDKKLPLLYTKSSDASQYDAMFVYEYFGLFASGILNTNDYSYLHSLGTVDHLGPHGQNWKGRVSQEWL